MQKSVVRRFYVSLPPFPCYNWLRKDEGRIFRDRSGGKLTTWIPRGVCQLYPYFSLGKSRSHLRQGGVPCVGSSRFTRWRRRDTADSIEIIVVDETKCKYEEEEEKEEKQRIRASCISKCYAFENQPFRRFLLLSLSIFVSFLFSVSLFSTSIYLPTTCAHVFSTIL